MYKAIQLHHPASAGIILLNLPTAVQSPRSKGDGRYDAGHDDYDPAVDVPVEYVLDTATDDDASAHDLTDDIIVNDVPAEVPDVHGRRCFFISKKLRNIY